MNPEDLELIEKAKRNKLSQSYDYVINSKKENEELEVYK